MTNNIINIVVVIVIMTMIIITSFCHLLLDATWYVPWVGTFSCALLQN